MRYRVNGWGDQNTISTSSSVAAPFPSVPWKEGGLIIKSSLVLSRIVPSRSTVCIILLWRRDCAPRGGGRITYLHPLLLGKAGEMAVCLFLRFPLVFIARCGRKLGKEDTSEGTETAIKASLLQVGLAPEFAFPPRVTSQRLAWGKDRGKAEGKGETQDWKANILSSVRGVGGASHGGRGNLPREEGYCEGNGREASGWQQGERLAAPSRLAPLCFCRTAIHKGSRELLPLAGVSTSRHARPFRERKATCLSLRAPLSEATESHSQEFPSQGDDLGCLHGRSSRSSGRSLLPLLSTSPPPSSHLEESLRPLPLHTPTPRHASCHIQSLSGRGEPRNGVDDDETRTRGRCPPGEGTAKGKARRLVGTHLSGCCWGNWPPTLPLGNWCRRRQKCAAYSLLHWRERSPGPSIDLGCSPLCWFVSLGASSPPSIVLGMCVSFPWNPALRSLP